MIKRLQLKNWKSFADATLVVQPLTVLVGTNASGKSNLLEAFSLLKRLADGFTLKNAFQVNHASFPIRGGGEWLIRRGEQRAVITIYLQHPEDDKLELKYELIFRREEGEQLILLKESLVVLDDEDNQVSKIIEHREPLPYPEKEGSSIYYNRSMMPAVGQMEQSNPSISVLNSVLYSLQNIHFLSPSPSSMRDYSSISNSLEVNASNVAGVLASRSLDDNIFIQERLTEYVRLLPDFDLKKVYAEAIKPLEKDAMLFGVENIGSDQEYLIDARTMSDGTLHFIGVITALLTVPEGSLLIMEEINQGLHPSRAKDLVKIIMDIIIERKIDVMFSTHDPALLDAIGVEYSENIQVVSRNESGLSVVRTLHDFKMFGKLIGRGSLGTLSTRGELAKAIFQ